MKSSTVFPQANEHSIQLAILQFLAFAGVYAWRNQSGALPAVYRGRKRLIRFGKVGSADILGVLPGGKLLAIEVKAMKGKVTPAQQEFLDNINSNGGVAFVARSIEDVQQHIGSLLTTVRS